METIVFKDRNSTYPGRKKLTIIKQEGNELLVDVQLADGPTEEGTKFNAELFSKIQKDIFDNANVASSALEKSQSALNHTINSDYCATSVNLTGDQTIAGNKTFTGTLNTDNLLVSDQEVETVVSSGLESGYIKYKSGLIIQWGVTQSTTATGALTVVLPIAFSNFNYGLSVGVIYGGTNWSSEIYVHRQYETHFLYYKYANSNVPMTWIAIGY